MKIVYIEVHAKWKHGSQYIVMRTSVPLQLIVQVEELVPDIPDYLDGIVSRIHLGNGNIIPCVTPYEDIITQLKEAQVEL